VRLVALVVMRREETAASTPSAVIAVIAELVVSFLSLMEEEGCPT
jgi:hypothetical protein